MDQAVLVGAQIEGGEDRIKQLRAAGIDVTGAFWVKTSDDEPWFLYIVSREVDNVGVTSAYRKIFGATSSHPVPWVDTFQLKVIGVGDPLAKAAIANQHAVLPTIYRQPYLGPLSIDEAYIYPESVTRGK